MGEEELVDEMLHLCMKDVPQRILSLPSALDASDVSGVCLVTHTIKGMVGNMSAGAMHSLAGEMEKAARSGNLDEVRKLMPELDVRLDQLKKAVESCSPTAKTSSQAIVQEVSDRTHFIAISSK